jgi:signal transduction histidine kinase/HAMP domain-containing protein
MKLRIRSKLLISFMAMVVLIAVLIGFALYSMLLMNNSNLRLVYIQEKEGLISDLQMTLDRAVTALGDYLVSGKKARRTTFIQLVLFYRRQVETLEEYQKYVAGEDEEIGKKESKSIVELKAELEKIDNSSRELMVLADKIPRVKGEQLIKEVGAVIKGALTQKANAGREVKPASDLSVLGELLGISTQEAQERIEELEQLSTTISESRWRELLAQLVEARDRALEKIAELREQAQLEGKMAVKMAAQTKEKARKYMFVGAIVVLTLGLALALYLSRSFSKPIMALNKGAKLIGDGDFDHRLAIETGDELEKLAGRFNAMSGKLKTSYTDLERRVHDRTRDLQRANEQLQRLFDGITDGISVIDRDYRIVSANKGIARMVGKNESDLKESKCFCSYNAGDSPCEGCPAAETFEKGTSSYAQIRWASQGQKDKEMEIRIFPLLEREGKITHVIEYAKDISDKKIMERKLFQSAKLAGIGTLAAGVAHEIRNPLGIIKTSADIIRRNSQEREQNYEMSEFIIDEVDRLNRVVSRLLNFARPSKPQIQPCDIHEILEKALALVGPQYRMQDIKVVKEYSKGSPRVLGDPEQLCQVFLNLVINAAQAMSDGGQLTLATGAKEEEKEVWASVIDTGPGIKKEILDSIFDPFFSTKEEGSGLGLAIVYRIVEAHKGRLMVKSEKGKGTTFTVVLPTV